MHEGNVSPHRLQRYTFCTYYIHISCIFYAFLTHMYQFVTQGYTPSRALVLASSWVPRWLLAQRATSDEGARSERASSTLRRQPSAVAPSAVSRCRQPLRHQPLPVALSRQPLPLPSAVSRCLCAVSAAAGGRRWRLVAALLRLGGRGQAVAACGGLGFGGQAVAAGVPKRRRLGVLCG